MREKELNLWEKFNLQGNNGLLASVELPDDCVNEALFSKDSFSLISPFSIWLPHLSRILSRTLDDFTTYLRRLYHIPLPTLPRFN